MVMMVMTIMIIMLVQFVSNVCDISVPLYAPEAIIICSSI